MKTKNKKKAILIIFLLLAYFLPVVVLAANNTNMEKIPGQTPTDDLIKYLNNLYNFGIAIAAILAVFMIALGSFKYIITSAGNASKMTDAKDTITNAIIGLILAFVAFLLLFIINPDLVKGTILGPEKVIKQINKTL